MTGLDAVLVVDGEHVPIVFDENTAEAILRALARGERARQRQLERTVRRYLAAHPDATANQVHRAVGGRRTDVLAAVRTIRESAQGVPARLRPVPRAGNRGSGGSR
jgi:hypothetical protein